eukprot:m.306738 g.306738  ORF g.306738 m.306738 type:complete len:101 (+) comp55309_c1_seq35:174-476(+)
MQPHMYTSLYAGDVMANLSGEDPLFVAFTVQESCRVYIFNYASGHLESISLPSVTHISAARAAPHAPQALGRGACTAPKPTCVCQCVRRSHGHHLGLSPL